MDIDPDLDVHDELFDATNPLLVEGIDFNAIMEGLSTGSFFYLKFGFVFLLGKALNST